MAYCSLPFPARGSGKECRSSRAEARLGSRLKVCYDYEVARKLSFAAHPPPGPWFFWWTLHYRALYDLMPCPGIEKHLTPPK